MLINLWTSTLHDLLYMTPALHAQCLFSPYLYRCSSKPRGLQKGLRQSAISISLQFFETLWKGWFAPDDDTVSRRTIPISWEWFLRPWVAVNEFAETLTENLKLPKDDNLTLVNTAKFATISQNVQPMLDAISCLNTRTREVSTKEDINTIMSYL